MWSLVHPRVSSTTRDVGLAVCGEAYVCACVGRVRCRAEALAGCACSDSQEDPAVAEVEVEEDAGVDALIRTAIAEVRVCKWFSLSLARGTS